MDNEPLNPEAGNDLEKMNEKLAQMGEAISLLEESKQRFENFDPSGIEPDDVIEISELADKIKEIAMEAYQDANFISQHCLPKKG